MTRVSYSLARLPRTLALRLEQGCGLIDADPKRPTKPTRVYLTEPRQNQNRVMRLTSLDSKSFAASPFSL